MRKWRITHNIKNCYECEEEVEIVEFEHEQEVRNYICDKFKSHYMEYEFEEIK